MVKAEKLQRDVKEEERKRERNGRGGGIYTFPVAEDDGTSFDLIGKKGPGVHVRQVPPSNLGRCSPVCL